MRTNTDVLDDVLPRWVRSVRQWATMAVRHANPGWFTSVMGTGILAVCAALSPVALPMLHPLSMVIWLTAVVLLAVIALCWLAQSIQQPQRLRLSLSDPVSAQFWGAPPIACFTVSLGFLVIGPHVMKGAWCISIAQVLWILGVIGSLFSIVLVPYLMAIKHSFSLDATSGSWLLPVVPPIVAGVPEGLLSPHWPHAIQACLLVLSYALWGMGMFLATIITVLFYARMMYRKLAPGPLVPAMWIALGPIGMSIVSLNRMCAAATHIWPVYGPELRAATALYGLPVWGFGMYWLVLAIAVTLYAVRKHLPFTLGWWAFTFPLGVLTASTYTLYTPTHAPVFAVAGVFLLLLLATLWALVASQTLRLMARSVRAATDPFPVQAASRRA